MAQMNPQLAALIMAMQNNPNADRGGPILGGHPGHQTVNNKAGLGDDGARYPEPGPGQGGFWGADPRDHPGAGPDPTGDSGIPRTPEGEQPWPGDLQNPNGDPSLNSTSLLGPHGTHLPGLLANLNALTSPGQYNTRHPLTLMRQIHPGNLVQPSKSGDGFGQVDQAVAMRQQVLSQMFSNR